MNFGKAIDAMKEGEKLQREGWNGKNMWLIYVPGTEHAELKQDTPYHSALNTESTGQSHVTIEAHIDMFTAAGCMQPGWLASQSDMLADDWQIIV